MEKTFLDRFLPNFYVHEQIKIALLLQLVAPEPINILIIGDPSTGKTSILKEMAQLHEKARYCEGAQYLPRFSPSIFLKGTLADIQLLCFNKLERASIADKHILTDLMSSGTAVLAAATPKFGRFDPYCIIVQQINLPPILLTRFDLIFPIEDLPIREKDLEVASLVLAPPDRDKTAISKELLRKQLASMQQTTNPQMTSIAIEELKKYYIATRNADTAEDGRRPPVPITARQLEALVRLSKAAAKIRQSASVCLEDAEKAIQLMHYCLHQIATDKETGKIDIDRLNSRLTATQRITISVVKEIINILREESKTEIIPVEIIVDVAKEKNIHPEQVEEALQNLRKAGDIFEPKPWHIQRL